MTDTDVATDLWYTRCPVPTASSIAITCGFLDAQFVQRSVGVRSIGESADPLVRMSHYTHTHPALFREGGVVPPIWAYANTQANRLLGVARVAQFQGLVALPDSGITRAEDLRGARIALPRRPDAPIDFSRAVSLQGIVSTLAAAGLSEADIVLVDVDFREPFLSLDAGAGGASVYTARENVRLHTAEVLALVRRDVDAIYVAGAHGLAIAAIIDAVPIPGVHERAEAAGDDGNHLRVLTVSSDLLDRRRGDVTQYLVGVLQAARWGSQHHDDAWATIAAEVGVATEWARSAYHPGTVDRLAPTSSEDAMAALQHRADFLYERQFIPRRIDIEQWHDGEPLDTALAHL